MDRIHVFSPGTIHKLELLSVHAEVVTYRQRPALKLIEQELGMDKPCIAILPGSNVGDGIIETEIAGNPRADAPVDMRGFVGLAFRVQPRGERFEYFFVRPTNGRAEDQLRRNHSTQYCSYPDHPWYRLREESPGVYESYTDLVAGAWTKIKIEVTGRRAQLYVNGADQPCLIVNDLKLSATEGAMALWIGGGTEGHFSDVYFTPR
jgi:hypothetical protein